MHEIKLMLSAKKKERKTTFSCLKHSSATVSYTAVGIQLLFVDIAGLVEL